MKLLALSHASDPDLLVIATAAGDIATMRSCLEGSPDKVYVLAKVVLCVHAHYIVFGLEIVRVPSHHSKQNGAPGES